MFDCSVWSVLHSCTRAQNPQRLAGLRSRGFTRPATNRTRQREDSEQAIDLVTPELLDRCVEIVGGVPAVLDAIGSEGRSVLREIVENRDSLWRLLGKLASEIRGAVDIVSGNEELAQRLEALALGGPKTYVKEADNALSAAGLILLDDRSRRASMRAPIFGDLAIAS